MLRELFQFDYADLDFGIYRIMNHKRDAIERFILETLPKTVVKELDLDYNQKTQSVTALKDVVRRIRESFGSEAIDSDGELNKNYLNTPLGKEHTQAKKLAADMGDRDAIEADVYNHLYEFFNHYYHEGDFISKRSYSKRHRYAIPYNGEEVYLHWANSDQHYIKTAEHFHDYDWKAAGGVTVRFEIRAASVEHGNIKDDKRFFLPLLGDIQLNASGSKKAVIPFEYRHLTAQETIKYGKQKQQDNIIAATIDEISNRLTDMPTELNDVLLGERHHNGSSAISHLEHHLRRYTRRNSFDFFIHKDLKAFLSRELDFYLKNEVLNLDEMNHAGEQNADGWFQKMRLIKGIGDNIIDFLTQIENFQKILWEKRKFVVETNYCITMGNIDPKFYPVIANNDKQWQEWREMLGLDENEINLLNVGNGTSDQRVALLRSHPTLMVDTKHFDQEFVDNLLAMDDLDYVTDGLLVHSENYQALRLLLETYSEHVKCIYIDPPYNTDASPIIYKNGYKDSSWLSLMEGRLQASLGVLEKNGIMCVAIDGVEHTNLQKLLKKICGDSSSMGTAVVRSAPSGRTTPTGFSSSHEYALFFANQHGAKVGRLHRTQKQIDRYDEADEVGRYEWVVFRKHGGQNAYRQRRRRLFYPIFVDADYNIRIPKGTWNESNGEWDIDDGQRKDENVIWPVNEKGEEKTWKWEMSTASENLSELLAKPNREKKMDIYVKSRMKEGTLPTTWWDKKEYSAAEHGTASLTKLFGNALGFDYPKSPKLIEDCLLASGCGMDSYVLDYFAGSGTTGQTVISLNRADHGRRKFILVEVEKYFNTVLLPRIKKVTYTPNWKDGKPERMATQKEAASSPRIIKYIKLESYEDALNNIEFETGQMTLESMFDDYLLKYMLKWETKKSGTLLNVESLTNPLDYKIKLHTDGETKVRTIDVPETFNYLLGLVVRFRRPYNDNGRKYLVYIGEPRDAPGRTVVVIWRRTDGWQKEDFEADKAFVEEHDLAGGADTIYVNGDSLIPNAKPVEKIFRDRMFAGVDT